MAHCRGLTSWVRKLSQQDMPVVGEVIGELTELTGSDAASANQLAEVILRDANLTSHVLRIANSVHYNYSGYPINTVSRAIVLIGFKGMRAICISSLVIDSFLKRGPRERLLQLMARAFYAATQARQLMLQRQDERAEEVFIAALLYHLGEMAFWASDSQLRDEEDLVGDGEAQQLAMEEALGTSFKAITLELARQWRLGETLEKALYPRSNPDPAVRAVVLGEALSRASTEGSWQSPAVVKLVQQIAEFTQLPEDEALTLIQEAARRTAEVAVTYGAEVVCRLLPGAQSQSASNEAPAHCGDPQVQLNILRELSMAAGDIADVNTIMRMVVEGMHRGVGLPRVAVAFTRHDRLQLKFALGDGTEHWRERFNFDVGPESVNLFNALGEKEAARWLQIDDLKRHPEWHSPVMIDVLGRHEAFVGVLKLGGNRVGVFYADGRGQTPLTQEQFDSFRHFQNQAQMNLMLMTQQRKSHP